jgi:defect in organelle trafficking protein DotD
VVSLVSIKNSVVVASIFAALTLSSCASGQKAPTAQATSPTNASLAEAATSVSNSLSDLARTEQAANYPVNVRPSPDPSSYGMGTLTSVDWSGPIEPLVNNIASIVNYRVSVIGNEPVIPVLVTIYARNDKVGNILQDAAFQCGSRASVIVYPSTQSIELRYAGN